MSTDTKSGGKTRRDFLKVLGATGAATTVVGCSTGEVEKLIPYLVSPDQTVPGVSTYYKTTCKECAAGCGVIAETRDGRATKLEGNPDHPVNRGALCARGQSAVQGLYNPDRYRGPMMRQGSALVATTWDKATAQLSQLLGQVKSRGGAGNAVFINASETGSFVGFLDTWLGAMGMPAAIQYDAEADVSAAAAHRQAYGAAWPRFDFTGAKLVVSFGADFLDNWGPSVPQQLDWADARAKLVDAPRFVYVGARRSLTGLNADEWIPCKPGSELAILNALRGQGDLNAAAQASGAPIASLQRLQQELAAARPALVLAAGTGPNGTDTALAAAALTQAAGGGALVKGAEGSPMYDRVASHADMRALIERMNAGQVSAIFIRGVDPVHTMPKSMGFAAAMAKVPVKVSFSSFPTATSELCDLILPDHHSLESWGDAQATPTTVSLMQPTMDPVFDTRATGDVLIAAAKGDPSLAARYPQATYRDWFISRFPGGAAALTAALPKGVVPGSTGTAAAHASATPKPAPAIDQTQGDYYLVVYPSALLGDGRGANKPWLQELSDPVSKISWQSWVEVHPLTAKKLGLEQGDHVTVKTASGSVTAPVWTYLGVRQDTVAIATGRGHTAYGRYAKGIGVNAWDLLASAEDPKSGGLALTSTKCTVTKDGGHSPLVSTEGSARQHGRGVGQAITLLPGARTLQASGSEHKGEGGAEGGAHGSGIQGEHGGPRGGGGTEGKEGNRPEGAAAQGGEHAGESEFPGDANHDFLPGLRSPVANDAQGDLGDPKSKDKGMYAPDHWSGMAKRRWAMTIDLARCTGCSACVTACYAENNIPTVGAPWQGRALGPGTWDERPGANILKGREMTWIRLERYFEGGEDGSSDFDTRFVPMMCQHCGNAPCEPVCPVYATYHAPDGLNVQVYNRCVGTRYCSNNCPYKVRYFNWFGFGEPRRRQYAFPEPLNWQLNPDVTVRGKGVMEKCSFCVQRIREAEHRARLEGRDVQPDEFTTACAQACPSRAITFGDADPNNGWTLAKMVNDERAYHVFEELNTYTAVVYLQKVNHLGAGQKDPAPAMAGHGEH